MTAALVSGKVDVNKPTVHATGARAEARSSVEVKDSCNCFKFCFPCFGKKTEKRSDTDRRTHGIATDTLQRTEGPDSSRHAQVRRSPAFDDMTEFTMMPRQQQQTVVVNVTCDHSTGTTPQQSSPVASDSSESTGKSA